MPAPVRILHVTKKLTPLPGGDASAVAGLSAAQRRNGYDVEVLAYRAPGVEASEHVHLAGPTQSPAGLDRIGVRRVRAMRALGRWARENLPRMRPDVVHAHAVDVGWPVAEAAHALGIPTILTCHGVWFTTRGPRSPLGRLEKSLLARGRYDAITSVDAASVRALQGAGYQEATLVPNGIDLSEFEGHQPHGGPFRMLSIGRLVAQKGFDVLIEAAALAHARAPEPFALVIVGDGPLRWQLAALAEARQASEYVLFRGALPRPELLVMLHTADAFVLASRFEGFPIAILEAWAVRVPVVATSVGGIPEACSGGEALLVPPEDPAALAEAMLAMMADPSRRASLARSGRQLVETRYTWDAIVDAYAPVYENAIRKGRTIP